MIHSMTWGSSAQPRSGDVVRVGVIGTDETVESGAGDLAAMVILTCQARIWASCCRKCRYPVSRRFEILNARTTNSSS